MILLKFKYDDLQLTTALIQIVPVCFKQHANLTDLKFDATYYFVQIDSIYTNLYNLAQLSIKNHQHLNLNYSVSYHFCSTNNGLSNYSDAEQTFAVNSKNGTLSAHNKQSMTLDRYELKVCAILADNQIERTVLVETQLFVINKLVSNRNEIQQLNLTIPNRSMQIYSNKTYLRLIELKKPASQSYWHSFFHVNLTDNWLYVDRHQLLAKSLGDIINVQIEDQNLDLTVEIKIFEDINLMAPVNIEPNTELLDLSSYFNANVLTYLIFANEYDEEVDLFYLNRSSGILYTNVMFDHATVLNFDLKYISKLSEITIGRIRLNIIDASSSAPSHLFKTAQNKYIQLGSLREPISIELFAPHEMIDTKNVLISDCFVSCLNNAPNQNVISLFKFELNSRNLIISAKNELLETPIACNLVEVKLKLSINRQFSIVLDISKANRKHFYQTRVLEMPKSVIKVNLSKYSTSVN